MPDMNTVTVTELRWAKLVYPPVGDDTTTWVPCTTADGRPAALALDDQERVALGSRLLHRTQQDTVVLDEFFKAERLYFRAGVTFRCDGLARHPHTTEQTAFGFEHHGSPQAPWAPTIRRQRSWQKGWQDITCPEHGYTCTPFAPAADCGAHR
ncbi:hypothetical protein [Streptomyces yangpuensis]|uniref:hypothetical protein n=1 Tax=Streptomyces yangpuensis TaxID=1648182 RepID=UPI0036559B8C